MMNRGWLASDGSERKGKHGERFGAAFFLILGGEAAKGNAGSNSLRRDIHIESGLIRNPKAVQAKRPAAEGEQGRE